MIEKKNEFVLNVGGYGITCDIDIDYDNPDVEKMKEIVLNDFSRKMLAIHNEYMYAMPNSMIMYGIFKNRYYVDATMSITQEYKKDIVKMTDCDAIAGHVYDYFKSFYVGPNDMMVKSAEEIRRWWQSGEFPFIYIHLIRNMDGKVTMFYTISR